MNNSFSGLFEIAIIVMSFSAWITHIITCLYDGLWVFLITGAIVFPIGIIDGIGVWLGAW